MDGPAWPCLAIETISIGVRGWYGNILGGFLGGIWEVWDWLSAERWINKGIVRSEPGDKCERRVK